MSRFYVINDDGETGPSHASLSEAEMVAQEMVAQEAAKLARDAGHADQEFEVVQVVCKYVTKLHVVREES
jgi:hypothetical protein